jgi:hypothetical protein
MVLGVDEVLVLLPHPCLRSFEGGKSVYALHSRMSVLDCPDDDINDVAFI